MISTFFGQGALDSPAAFLMAGLIGLLFGFSLERAGLASSRKIAGVFSFRDMTVLKVMFTALLTAMLGLQFLLVFGLVAADQIHWLPTLYGGQVLGGLLLGAGFGLAGWCPGTAAAGLATGRLDALVFLVGAVLGCVVYNEVFPFTQRFTSWGDLGVVSAWETLKLSKGHFILGLTVLGAACLVGAEFVERANRQADVTIRRTSWPLLAALCVGLIGAASGFLVLPPAPPAGVAARSAPLAGPTERPASQTAQSAGPNRLAEVERGAEHVEPEDLADRLMAGESGLLTADVRSAEEFAVFHLPGAVNIPLSRLEAELEPFKNQGTIVLYSNGMVHPAQAADQLARQGFANVFILTDGLEGFLERVLRPVSLREPPLPEAQAAKVRAWRAFFLKQKPDQELNRGGGRESTAGLDAGVGPAGVKAGLTDAGQALPGLVDADWLAARLDRPGLRVVDVRPQPAYNGGHIPGAVRLDPESLRGAVDGLPSMLLPGELLAAHFSLLGLSPLDLVVIAAGDRPIDATLFAMACERLGHVRYAILDGGVPAWQAAGRPLTTVLPEVTRSRYPAPPPGDGFTVDAATVLAAIRSAAPPVVLDVRPADYYAGTKSDEARAGHIPGAINHPFTEDQVKSGDVVRFKPVEELARSYAGLIPDQETPVIVHCRTGHQASLPFFVLTRLLGYKNVRFYDAGWTEWAAKPTLPVETGGSAAK